MTSVFCDAPAIFQKSAGEPRRTPVNLLTFEGDRYLVQCLEDACPGKLDVGGHPLRSQPTALPVTQFTEVR